MKMELFVDQNFYSITNNTCTLNNLNSINKPLFAYWKVAGLAFVLSGASYCL